MGVLQALLTPIQCFQPLCLTQFIKLGVFSWGQPTSGTILILIGWNYLEYAHTWSYQAAKDSKGVWSEKGGFFGGLRKDMLWMLRSILLGLVLLKNLCA